MSRPVLRVSGLKKTYKRTMTSKAVNALKGISFQIEPGTITGFLGANGAGKTTTIKCLLDLAFPDEGKIEYFGSESLTTEAKARIGFLPERPYFYEYLSGREFLKFYGELSTHLSRLELDARIDELLQRVGLVHASHRPLRSYSKGMLQRIGIAQALIHRPEFIILDEPMTGLDPDGRFEVREIIRETAASGTAVFFSSHLLPDAEQLCERLVILKQGELVFEGATLDLIGRAEKGYKVQSASNGRLQTSEVATSQELQALIDSLRAAGSDIIEVKPIRSSLEEVFVRIAFDGKEGRT